MVRDGRGRRWAAGPPHVLGRAEAVLPTSAEQVLEAVMDVEGYQDVDPRLHRIMWVRRSADQRETVFRFFPRLGPLPALAPSTQRVVLDPGRGVRITADPSWTDAVLRFEGSLTCEPLQGGVRVRRELRFWLAPPLRLLLGRSLQEWLDQDVPRELSALSAALEPDAWAPGTAGGAPLPSGRPGPSRTGRRGLQVALGVLACIPAASGLAGMLIGPRALPRDAREPAGGVAASLDSEYRFTNAFWFALAPLVWSTLPHVETRTAVLRAALGTTALGGLARLLAWRTSGRPHPALLAATALELVGAPALLLWQHRTASAHRRSAPRTDR